jgi:hypothetical protein
MVVDSAAVWDRLRAHFSRPPPGSPPAETLRWVRRVMVGMLPLSGLVWLQAWATDVIPLWLAVALVGLSASSAVSLTIAIRASEKEAAKRAYTQPTPEQIRRKERRVGYAMVVVLCVSMPVVGYFIDGLPSAAFFLVMAVLGSGLSLWVQRRYWGR